MGICDTVFCPVLHTDRFSSNSSVITARQSLFCAAVTQKTVTTRPQCPNPLHGCAGQGTDEIAGAWGPAASADTVL